MCRDLIPGGFSENGEMPQITAEREVLEDRNNGIGTKMISNAENIDIHTICLHVEKSNTAAFRLYQRLGYEIYEEQGSRYLMVKCI